MKAETQEGVHQVVFAGDGIKVFHDKFNFFLRLDLAIPKMGHFLLVFSSGCLSYDPDPLFGIQFSPCHHKYWNKTLYFQDKGILPYFQSLRFYQVAEKLQTPVPRMKTGVHPLIGGPAFTEMTSYRLWEFISFSKEDPGGD